MSGSIHPLLHLQGDLLGATNQQGAGMIGRGTGMIRKRLLPHPEVVYGTELDIGEQVFSGAWDP